jgi:alkylhydroperoxidase/carboxymuconolactone decarboxylase family protein YurZ
MTTGNERGVVYQVIAGREWGATKREVLDVIELGFLVSGPFGVNAAAERADEYLRAWPDDEPRRVFDPWPEGWAPDGPGVHRTGLDLSVPELSDAELAAVEDSYRRRGLDVPAYVPVLARHAPGQLKTLQGRYEGALADCALPRQVPPLIELHWTAIAGRADAAAAVARAARQVGVTKAQALETLGWAFLYASESTMSALAPALEPILEGWE